MENANLLRESGAADIILRTHRIMHPAAQAPFVAAHGGKIWVMSGFHHNPAPGVMSDKLACVQARPPPPPWGIFVGLGYM